MTHIVYRGRHIYVKPHPGIVEAEVGGNVETSAGDLGIASVLQTGTASCINIYLYKPSNCYEVWLVLYWNWLK